jgi:hypothetical protein
VLPAIEACRNETAEQLSVTHQNRLKAADQQPPPPPAAAFHPAEKLPEAAKISLKTRILLAFKECLLLPRRGS